MIVAYSGISRLLYSSMPAIHAGLKVKKLLLYCRLEKTYRNLPKNLVMSTFSPLGNCPDEGLMITRS